MIFCELPSSGENHSVSVETDLIFRSQVEVLDTDHVSFGVSNQFGHFSAVNGLDPVVGQGVDVVDEF